MTPRTRRVISLGAALVLAAFCTSTQAEPDSKWKLEVDNASQTAGELILRFAPLNGTPIDVTTKFPEGIGENHAARLLRDSLRATLGKGYKIQVDDGEEVLIRRNGKTPKFEITLVSSTVAGLSVKIERD